MKAKRFTEEQIIAVLKQAEVFGHFPADEVGAGAEDLAEFHGGRAQFGERGPQTPALGFRFAGGRLDEPEAPQDFRGQPFVQAEAVDHVRKPVAHQHLHDFGQPHGVSDAF